MTFASQPLSPTGAVVGLRQLTPDLAQRRLCANAGESRKARWPHLNNSPAAALRRKSHAGVQNVMAKTLTPNS